MTPLLSHITGETFTRFLGFLAAAGVICYCSWLNRRRWKKNQKDRVE